MSSTILMAIVLVVMWLVVLVPMFVRRGDERAETRSTERFATAMRVLSRRTPGTGGVAGRRRYVTAAPAPYADGASPVRTAARDRMLRRRRRTLAVLAATAVFAAPAALLVSPWLWLAQLPATLMLVGYVGWLRQQVRREQVRRSRRREMFGPADRPVAAEHVVRRGARVAAQAPAEVAAADRSWRPVPVPAPGYVTAPVVRRRGDSMVGLDDEDPTFVEIDTPAYAYDEDYERPRAVNE